MDNKLSKSEPKMNTKRSLASNTIRLSPREHDVYTCLIQGMRMDEAATNLGLSVNTVKTHIKRIYRKRKVGSQIELIMRTLKEHGCKCLEKP